MRTWISLALLACVVAFGCKKSLEDEKKDVREAQQERNEAVQDKMNEAQDAAQKGQEKVNEKREEAHDAAVEGNKQIQEEQKDVREREREIQGARPNP